MINLFYGFGIISIFVSVFWLIMNWHNTEEVDIDMNIKSIVSVIKGLMKNWDFFFHVGYLIWIIVGLFSSQLFLFSLLVFITFGVPNFYKNMPRHIIKGNEMLNILIMILILRHHYFIH